MFPCLTDRELCMCSRYEHALMMANKLHYLKVIPTTNLFALCQIISCDDAAHEYMYRRCTTCKERKCVTTAPGNDIVTWNQWGKETLTNSTKITKKISKNNSIVVLIQDFENELGALCTHIFNFNLKNQYKSIRYLRQTISTGEAIIHIDFSENYCVEKYGREITSIHFGGSHAQVSLHTGILYLSEVSQPFCSVSECLRHDACGIWPI